MFLVHTVFANKMPPMQFSWWHIGQTENYKNESKREKDKRSFKYIDRNRKEREKFQKTTDWKTPERDRTEKKENEEKRNKVVEHTM